MANMAMIPRATQEELQTIRDRDILGNRMLPDDAVIVLAEILRRMDTGEWTEKSNKEK